MSGSQTRQRYFYGFLPRHVQRALWDYAAREGVESSRKLRCEVISRYVNRLEEEEITNTKEHNPMGYRRGVELMPLLLDLPAPELDALVKLCDRIGADKDVVITLAIDQFLRANGILATPRNIVKD